MHRYRTSGLALFIALGALAACTAPAFAAPIEWTVRGVSSDGTPLLTVSDANKLLSGQIPSKTDKTGQYNVVNFNEPDRIAGGLFPNDSAFPGITVGHETEFAAEATGNLLPELRKLGSA